MKALNGPAAALVATACLSLAPLVQAAPIVLDFDSAGTGLGLGSAPLVVGAGTVTMAGGQVTASGHPTNGLLSDQGGDDDSLRTLLSFDFDVSSITFDFAGEGIGNFLAEALDANGAVLASYAFTDTRCSITCFDGTDIVLAADGIRGFRFADSPGSFGLSLVDNVRLAPGTVPEPASFGLASLALLGLGGVMRRKRSPA